MTTGRFTGFCRVPAAFAVFVAFFLAPEATLATRFCAALGLAAAFALGRRGAGRRAAVAFRPRRAGLAALRAGLGVGREALRVRGALRCRRDFFRAAITTSAASG